VRVPIQTRKTQLATLLPHIAPTATVVVVLVWAFRDGGYPTTSWYPAGVLVGGLLIAQILGRSLHVGWDLQTAVVGSVFAFALVELASILWASSKGAAWDSANRTFTYGFIFLMFAGWRSSERTKHLLALLLIGGLTAIGIWSLHSAAQSPGTAFLFSRLSLPTGYANATAALFLIPFWPAVSLAADRNRAVLFRAFALGCAASLAAVAFVPESRGALYAFPVVVVVLLVLARNRLRTSLALIVALAPTAYFIHTLSKPYSAVGLAAETHAANQAAVAAILAGVFAALLGAAFALADQRFELTLPSWYRYVRIAALALVVAAAIGLAGTHDPRAAARSAWTSFRVPEESGGVGGTRLLGNLGSNRYDFWRVALGMAKRHPLLGVGADNFSEGYLQHRRSGEQPQYPHSLEMSVLSQTGAIGSLAFLLFVSLAGVAVARARRFRASSAALVAGCATAFAYWLIHGSVDWLWEFPALGGTAFIFLALAISRSHASAGPRSLRLAVVVATAVIAASFVAPWLAARQTERAAVIWRSDPSLAYSLLDQAAGLNPLSDTPDLTKMTIAAQLGDVARMQASAERAIGRDHHNWFSQLQLAVALSHQHQWSAARRAAAEASQLNPSEPLIGDVLTSIRRHSPLRLDALNTAVRNRLEALDPRLRPSRKAH
jgi:O-antigen ligase